MLSASSPTDNSYRKFLKDYIDDSHNTSIEPHRRDLLDEGATNDFFDGDEFKELVSQLDIEGRTQHHGQHSNDELYQSNSMPISLDLDELDELDKEDNNEVTGKSQYIEGVTDYDLSELEDVLFRDSTHSIHLPHETNDTDAISALGEEQQHPTISSNVPVVSNSPLKMVPFDECINPTGLDMLIEAKNECASLRDLNERLLQANNDQRVQLIQMEERMKQNSCDLNSQHETQIKHIQELALQKQSLLEAQISSLNAELEKARSSSSQISDIRSSIQREKEIDVMTIKKELLAQKERHLFELRNEMMKQREELAEKYDADLASATIQFSTQKATLEAELDINRAKLEQALLDLRVGGAKPQRSDFSQQFSDSGSLNRSQSKNANNVMQQVWVILGGDSDKFQQLVSTSNSYSVLTDHVRSYLDKVQKELLNLKIEVGVTKEHLDEAQLKYKQLESTQIERINSLKRAHMAELAEQKVSLEAQIALVSSEANNQRERLEGRIKQLGSKLTASKQSSVNSFDPKASLSEITLRFPTQMSQYRSEIESKMAKQLSQKEKEYSEALSNISNEQNQIINELKRRFEDEKESMIANHRADIQKVSTRLKEHCANAYDTAIMKLKSEYLKLEAQLITRFNSEKELYVDKMERSRKEDVENAVVKAKSEITAFVKAQYDAKLSHLMVEVNETKKRSSTELSTIKQKYLSTVYKMRDEMAVQKEETLAKMQTEWDSKKGILEREIRSKLETLHIHCEAHHSGCRCNQLIMSIF